MRFRTEFAIYAVLLVALAANPVWFFPHAADPAYEYNAVEITEENRFDLLWRHPSILQCDDARRRECGFETAAVNGGIVLNGSSLTYSGDTTEYEYVLFPDGFQEPTMYKSGETVTLTLERRSRKAVVRGLAYPYAEASEQARAVVKRGQATVFTEVPARDRIVRRQNTYYFLRDEGERGQPLGGWVPRYRWMLWLGTVPASVAAMWRWS